MLTNIGDIVECKMALNSNAFVKDELFYISRRLGVTPEMICGHVAEKDRPEFSVQKSKTGVRLNKFGVPIPVRPTYDEYLENEIGTPAVSKLILST